MPHIILASLFPEFVWTQKSWRDMLKEGSRNSEVLPQCNEDPPARIHLVLLSACRKGAQNHSRPHWNAQSLSHYFSAVTQSSCCGKKDQIGLGSHCWRSSHRAPGSPCSQTGGFCWAPTIGQHIWIVPTCGHLASSRGQPTTPPHEETGWWSCSWNIWHLHF